MKRILSSAILSVLTSIGYAQSVVNFSNITEHTLFGVKAGINISNVTNAANIRAKSKLGYMAGVFSDMSFGKLTGLRNEIIYSRQGFNYETSTQKGAVNLDYIFFTNLMTFNLGTIAQIQVGPQAGYLARAVVDTARKLINTNPGKLLSITKQTNRITYGACAGFEIYPWRGLLVGARYNRSFTSFLKRQTYTATRVDREYGTVQNRTSFSSSDNSRFKEEVIQIFAGWRFGGGVNKNDKKK
jgi:outer membrane protein with beta-barrel domain